MYIYEKTISNRLWTNKCYFFFFAGNYTNASVISRKNRRIHCSKQNGWPDGLLVVTNTATSMWTTAPWQQQLPATSHRGESDAPLDTSCFLTAN